LAIPAASRAFANPVIAKAANMPTMAITTRSSIKVKAPATSLKRNVPKKKPA
jgi:hypothetical protein